MGSSRNSLFINKNVMWLLFSSIAIASSWFFLWLFPWQGKLDSTLLRLGIALVVFTLPGAALSVLLSGRGTRWVQHILFGFVLSHLLIAFGVTMGRVFHLSFDLVRNSFMVLGCVFLVAAILRYSSGSPFQLNWTALKKEGPILVLGLVSLLVILIVLQRQISDDDLSYLVFLTKTQYSNQLSFNDVFFGVSQPVTSRFWLMSAPFAQALLSDLSRVPGILVLSGYYEPFLVIISVLAWYELAIALKLSPRAASASVILQLLFLLLLSEYLHPGSPYLTQLSADKATAAFIFAPVFFLSLIRSLEDAKWSNLFLFLLSGLSLTFMHPIILAYAIFIGGLLILFRMNGQNVRSRLITIFLLAMIILPQVVIRFVQVPSAQNVSYDNPEASLASSGSDNLVSRWGETRFYGFNPGILFIKIPYETAFPLAANIAKWGWLLIPLGSFLLGLRRRDQAVSQFIIAGFIVCFLTWFPFTGWIMGYFLNPRMLARSVWLFPYGLSAVFLLVNVRDMLKSGSFPWAQKLTAWTHFSNVGLIVLTVLFSITALLFLREQQMPDMDRFGQQSRRYGDMVRVGQYLDNRSSTQVHVIGSEVLNDYIPGVSGRANLVVFRVSESSNMLYYTLEEIEQRVSDRQTLFSETTSPAAKLELLRKYDIKFIVLTGADRGLFTRLLEQYPSVAAMEKVARFFVIEIKDE
jgi:hypothetical protein